MRKLFGLLAAVVLVTGLAAPASSATLTLTGSTLSLTIGALPAIVVPQGAPTLISVTGVSNFTEPSSVFGPTNIILPTQLFTGVSLISSFNATGLGNGTKVITSLGGPGGGVGGVGGLLGQAKIGVLGGLVNLTIPLGVAGGGGVTTAAAASLAITVTGDTWTTGTATHTKITTTPGATVLNTVSLAGTNNLNSVSGGTITLVTPIRILTNAAGNLPGFAIQTLTFVPEPGTLLLIGSGIVGLGLVGRRKLRK